MKQSYPLPESDFARKAMSKIFDIYKVLHKYWLSLILHNIF